MRSSRRIVRSWRAACATIELRSPTALLDVGLAKQITTKVYLVILSCTVVLNRSQMDEGVTKAKTADTRTMKTYVPGLLAKLYGVLDPPLYGSEKAGRGYTHRVTAKLLFPVTLPFTEEYVLLRSCGYYGSLTQRIAIASPYLTSRSRSQATFSRVFCTGTWTSSTPTKISSSASRGRAFSRARFC